MAGNDTTHNCARQFDYGGIDDEHFGDPMQWIGLYVLVASFLCAAAMGANIVGSWRRSKLWVSPKLFALNAAVLTILGVATKIPNDINGKMPGLIDQLSKLSGTLLLCVAMTHAMPSLGVMDNWELLSNLVALGILVISMAANTWIQVSTGVITRFAPLSIFYTVGMLFMFSILVSHSLSVATIKQRPEEKYQSKHWDIEKEVIRRGILSGEELRGYVKKYWLMALTSSPDFVLMTSGMSGACLFTYIMMAVGFAGFLLAFAGKGVKRCYMRSDYKWTTGLILLVQLLQAFLGFATVLFRLILHGRLNWGTDRSVRKYRFEQLSKWKKDPLSSLVRNERVRSAAYHAKNLGVHLMILFQWIMTFLTKFLPSIPYYAIMIILTICCYYPFRLICSDSSKGEENLPEANGRSSEEEALSFYVLSLEGIDKKEEKDIAKKWKDNPDKWFAIGQARQPVDLHQLVSKAPSRSSSSGGGSSGVLRTTSSIRRSPTLTFGDLEDCWSLHLSTLMCVIYAAFGGSHDLGSLSRALDEGFLYYKLVDASNGRSSSKKALKAAKMVWENLRFRREWLDKPLLDKQSDFCDIIRGLKAKAGEHKNDEGRPEQLLTLEDVAARSMSRIAGALLDCNRAFSLKEMEEVAAGVAANCLVNLPTAILRECSNGGYGHREGHVRVAALVLGETQEMLENLGALQPSSSNVAPV